MIKNGFYGRYGFEDGKYNLNDFAYDKKNAFEKGNCSKEDDNEGSCQIN